MKTNLRKIRFGRSVATLIALASAAIGNAAADVPAPKSSAAGAEHKTHTLFMGADISVEQNKKLYRLKDVAGGAFVIEMDGRRFTVPADQGRINMNVNLGLKLTERSAFVADLKGDRAYTPANDPNRRFAREAPGGSASAQTDLALGALNAAQTAVSAAEASVNAAPNEQSRSMALASAAQAQQSFNRTLGQFDSSVLAQGSDLNTNGYYAMKLQEELEKKLFDALEVTFEVSADQPLDSPYVVLIAWYREKDAKPSQGSTLIYAQALQPIDRQPRKVRIRQGGFPLGYELVKYQVHLYDHGVEVATNVAPKRVELTRAEAFEYVLLDYVGSHKGATLPGAPAMGMLPDDFHQRLATGKLVHTLFVKVTKDGEATAAFLDEACTHPADDPYVESLVKRILFKPALDKGKPVDGVVPLKLNDLSF